MSNEQDLSDFGSAPPESGLTEQDLELPDDELRATVEQRETHRLIESMTAAGKAQGGTFDDICNNGIKSGRLTAEDAATWLRGGVLAIAEHSPNDAALVVRALSKVDGLAERYRRKEPALAASLLIRDAQKIAALVEADDDLNFDSWLAQRQKAIAEKNAPKRTYVSRSAGHASSDKLPTSEWLKVRNAEIAKKEGRS